MRIPENTRYVLFGGTFMLANRLQLVGDRFTDGFSIKQWFLLRNLVEMPTSPPPTIAQVAQAMDSTRQNTAKMLGSMQRVGLVTLGKSKVDLRRRTVCITPLGHECLAKATKVSQPFLDQVYADIDEADRAIAAKVLIKMADNLQNLMDSPTKTTNRK